MAVLQSGWLTTGPRVERFEREFAAYVGAQYALGRRFSVFGELGAGFARTETAPTTISQGITIGVATSKRLSVHSGAGVVLYF